MYDLELSRRLCIIKYSRAISRVKWFKHEEINVSRSISVLVLSVLDFRTLRTTSCLNHLTRLIAREDFIIHEDVKSRS
jgi:hypothetical protein